MFFSLYLPGILKNVIMNTLSITALVMVMLLLVEFINVSSSGKWMEKIKHKPFLQIIISGLMGLIPGCLGGFAVVSLFTHNLISFSALLAGMISSFGDEVFVLFAISPKWTLFLALVLLITGIISGCIVHLFFRKKNHEAKHDHTFEIHHDCSDHQHPASLASNISFKNLKNISFPRVILIFGLLAYLFLLLSGILGHNHGLIPEMPTSSLSETEITCSEHDHHHGELDAPTCQNLHEHEHEHDHGTISWETILFASLALITLCIVCLSSEHFLHSHLWEHVIKKHFLTIFSWTFGVLLFIQILLHFFNINAFVAEHQWALLLLVFIAVLIGLIPESGPHLIFVIMFFGGAIPFSILLANSIVQDGHSALPLLAESRKQFFFMKGVKVVIGLGAGLLGYFIGF